MSINECAARAAEEAESVRCPIRSQTESLERACPSNFAPYKRLLFSIKAGGQIEASNNSPSLFVYITVFPHDRKKTDEGKGGASSGPPHHAYCYKQKLPQGKKEEDEDESTNLQVFPFFSPSNVISQSSFSLFFLFSQASSPSSIFYPQQDIFSLPPPLLRKRRVGHKGNCDTSHDGGDKKALRKKSGGKGESFSRADK